MAIWPADLLIRQLIGDTPKSNRLPDKAINLWIDRSHRKASDRMFARFCGPSVNKNRFEIQALNISFAAEERIEIISIVDSTTDSNIEPAFKSIIRIAFAREHRAHSKTKLANIFLVATKAHPAYEAAISAGVDSNGERRAVCSTRFVQC